jgi:hypothetical protein
MTWLSYGLLRCGRNQGVAATILFLVGCCLVFGEGQLFSDSPLSTLLSFMFMCEWDSRDFESSKFYGGLAAGI